MIFVHLFVLGDVHAYPSMVPCMAWVILVGEEAGNMVTVDSFECHVQLCVFLFFFFLLLWKSPLFSSKLDDNFDVLYRILVIIDKFNKLVSWSITAQSPLTSPIHRFQASVRVTRSCDPVKMGYLDPSTQLAVKSSAVI